MKNSDKLVKLVTSFVMAGFMSTALSGVFTFLAFGLSVTWLINWAQSVFIAWPIAMSLDMLFGADLRGLSTTISNYVERKRAFRGQPGGVRPMRTSLSRDSVTAPYDAQS